MIRRYSGRFHKVIKVRSRGDNTCVFGCQDLDNENQSFNALSITIRKGELSFGSFLR